MTDDPEHQFGIWLVLTTHPHRESQAMEHLRRQDFRVYCPMTAKRIHHARRAYDTQRPLFPGYVFAEQPDLQQRWRPLLSTIGVRSVITQDDKPARLPQGFVESLMAREVEGAICRPEEPFQIGQQVAIKGGPFDGLIGQIVQMKPNDRVLVLLDLLKRKTAVHIQARQLV
jgi:transcriptional antiterminator RfaH